MGDSVAAIDQLVSRRTLPPEKEGQSATLRQFDTYNSNCYGRMTTPEAILSRRVALQPHPPKVPKRTLFSCSRAPEHLDSIPVWPRARARERRLIVGALPGLVLSDAKLSQHFSSSAGSR
jgi:hypothetical protein